MANTGNKIVLTLKEVQNPGATPTGNKKPNLPADEDYIAPYQDLVNCPVSYALTCPVMIFTRGTNNLSYEFNLANNVVRNPVVKKVKVTLSAGSFSQIFVLPNTPSENYFSGIFTGLTSGVDYNFIVTYLGITDNVLATCNTDVP